MIEELKNNAIGYCMTDEEYLKTDGKTGRFIYFNPIRHGDFIYSGDFIEVMQAKLDAQAEELEALRGFANMVVMTGQYGISHEWIIQVAIANKLLDENGKPTPMLTGVKE